MIKKNIFVFINFNNFKIIFTLLIKIVVIQIKIFIIKVRKVRF